MALDAETIRNALILLFLMIVSLSLHEWGHAWTADRLGDDTPRSRGRVTFNPLAHIDPIGTIAIPLLCALGVFGGFGVIGWARPVPINPAAYRNRNWDQSLVTIAGPAMNVLLGIFAVFAAAACARFAPAWADIFLKLLGLNVLLIVFNLLPVPPLDGSKFLMYWFGMGEEAYYNFARWGWLILIVLVNLRPFAVVFGTLYYYAGLPFQLLYRALI